VANRRLRKELLETVRDLNAVGAIDFKKLQEFETSRVVKAPAPFVPPSAPGSPNCVVSVVLQPGESIEWTWTTDANGAHYVSGYTIVGPQRKTRARPATR
jgi:hypothetical protein